MTCPFCDNPNQPSWTTCPCPGADNARLYGVKDAWQHHQTTLSNDSPRNPTIAPTPTTTAQPDNPQTDGTDSAHPAWWRGLNTGLTQAAHIIDNASLGNDDPSTVLPDNHPLDATRKRVLTLAQPHDNDNPPTPPPSGYTPGSLPSQPSDDTGPSQEARRDQADLIAALTTPKPAPRLPHCDDFTRDTGDCGPEASAFSTDLDDRREAVLLFAAGIAATNPDLATWINRAATAVLSGEAIPIRRPPKVRGKGRRRGG